MCLANVCCCTRRLFEKQKRPYLRLFLQWFTLDNLINPFKATFQRILQKYIFHKNWMFMCQKKKFDTGVWKRLWGKDTECHIIFVFMLESWLSKCKCFAQMISDRSVCRHENEMCSCVCWMNTEGSSAFTLLIMILCNLKFYRVSLVFGRQFICLQTKYYFFFPIYLIIKEEKCMN